jgi:hypothetical protein
LYIYALSDYIYSIASLFYAYLWDLDSYPFNITTLVIFMNQFLPRGQLHNFWKDFLATYILS